MNRKAEKMLTKLVSLKRQRAEQALGEAHQALREGQARLEAIKEELRKPPPELDFTAISLSATNNHAGRLLGMARAQEAAIRQLEAEVEVRKQALRQAFGSEQLLSDVTRARR